MSGTWSKFTGVSADAGSVNDHETGSTDVFAVDPNAPLYPSGDPKSWTAAVEVSPATWSGWR